MNENLNLCKILRCCPKGKSFWSPCWGKVTFEAIDPLDGLGGLVYVQTLEGIRIVLHEDGKLDADGECMIFPSKGQRDWSKFNGPIEKFSPEEFKPFDKILIRDEGEFKWHPSFLEKIVKEPSGGYSVIELVTRCRWDMCIPYNEETEHLSWTKDDCLDYYKWWEK